MHRRQSFRYDPGKRDQRVAEAQAMLKARPNLNGLTAWSLVSQFNLKPPTAAKVLEIERLRRERAP